MKDLSNYENLDWSTWHMLTGLPKEAYNDWLNLRPASRAEIVDIFQTPDDIEEIREVKRNLDND